MFVCYKLVHAIFFLSTHTYSQGSHTRTPTATLGRKPSSLLSWAEWNDEAQSPQNHRHHTPLRHPATTLAFAATHAPGEEERARFEP